jgi:hypothetical protein
LRGDVCTQVDVRGGDFGDDRLAAVDQRDDVGEVAAAKKVVIPSAGERLELRGEQICGRDGTNATARRELSMSRVRKGLLLPFVLEAEDPRSAYV